MGIANAQSPAPPAPDALLGVSARRPLCRVPVAWRAGRAATAVVRAALCAALFVAAGAALAGDGAKRVNQDQSLHDLHYGVHLPRDRSLARGLDVARELLDESRYGESLPVLVRVLQAPEDAYDNPRSTELMSLKRQAAESIRSLGPDGLRAYLLEVEAEAEREFRNALERDDAALLDIARRYPRTDAARVATWAAAQCALEMGHFSKAATLFQHLSGDEDLSVERRSIAGAQRAIALMALGRVKAAQGVLAKLPGDKASVARMLAPATAADQVSAERLADLTAAFAARLSPPREGETDWLTSGGDARRNPILRGELPHLWARWRASAPGDARLADNYATLPPDKAAPAAATNPLLVGPYVVARSGNAVVGLNRDSGKLAWRAPVGAGAERQLPTSALMRIRADNSLLANLLARPRLDAVASRLSSDGRRVYAISTVESDDDDAARMLGPLLGVRTRGGESVGNQLIALDAHAEGKLAWRLGGRDGRRPAEDQLTGAFFLDVPLAVDGDLYVVAEVQQSIYLLQVRPESGEVLWRQALASVETPAEQDPMRRLVGAATCYAGGRILVSLGAGLVVAVDPLDRMLAWVYRFPVEGGARVASPSPWRRRSASWPDADERHWLRNHMIVAGGQVIIASPESQRLHAINARSGEEQWTSDLPSGRLLCAATDGVVVLTTPSRVLGIDAASGETRWDAPLPESTRPSGAGVCFGRQYVQPLSDGTVLQVDAATGETRERLRASPEGALGALAYDGRSLYSQSHEGVARFDPPPELSTAGIADAERERHAGELALVQGDPQEAVQHLRAAYRLSGKASEHAAALRELLLARITASELSDERLALLEELHKGRAAPMELTLARAQAAARDGREAEVVRLALEFCRTGDDAEQLIAVGPSRAVRPARALRAALSEAFGSLHAARGAPAVREALAGGERGGMQSALLAEVFGLVRPAAVDLASTAEAAALDTRWSVSQVEVDKFAGDENQRAPRGGRPRDAVFEAPLSGAPPTRVGLRSVAIVTDGRWLYGTNSYGEEVLRVELPKGAAESLQRHARSGGGAAAVIAGGWLYVGAGSDVLAVNARSPGAPADWAWTARRALEWAAPITRGGEMQRAIRRASAAETRLLGASSLGVTIATDGLLACLDPTTGEVLWTRTDLTEAEDAAADDQFAYSPRQVSDGWRASLVDGATSPCAWPEGRAIAVDGALVTLLDRDGEDTKLTLFDRRTQSASLIRNLRGAVHHDLADGVVALLDEEGRLEVVDREAPELVVSAKLDLPTRPTSVSVSRLGDRLLVGVHQGSELAGRAEGLTSLDNSPLLSGDLYSFNLATGERMWPAPAQISGKGLLERQPDHSPVVALASSYRARDGSGAYTALNLLMLDAATGRTLYRESGLRRALLREYRMRWERGPRPRVTLALDDMYVTLTASDAPAPPAPPATAAVELAGESSPGDLGWMGRRLGRFLEEGFGIKVDEPRGEDDD